MTNQQPARIRIANSMPTSGAARRDAKQVKRQARFDRLAHGGRVQVDAPPSVPAANILPIVLLEQEQLVSESTNTLILDQPDTITTHGKVEQVEVEDPNQICREQDEGKQPKERLFTEEPIEGLDIITD